MSGLPHRFDHISRQSSREVWSERMTSSMWWNDVNTFGIYYCGDLVGGLSAHEGSNNGRNTWLRSSGSAWWFAKSNLVQPSLSWSLRLAATPIRTHEKDYSLDQPCRVFSSVVESRPAIDWESASLLGKEGWSVLENHRARAALWWPIGSWYLGHWTDKFIDRARPGGVT
jgi:hypothetical protein